MNSGPFTFEMLMTVVWNLVNFLIWLARVAIGLTLLWFGSKMILARGDETKFAEAKKGLTWAVIGALVIFGAGTIILTLQTFVDSL